VQTEIIFIFTKLLTPVGNYRIFNPIPAGVLENQDTLGGGVNLPPPSKSHVLCPNMTNDTSLESYCALLLESAKKFALDHAISNMQKFLQNFK